MAKLKTKPKYEMILDTLLAEITSDFKKDDLFYSQRDLIGNFNVSYITVSRVLKELKLQGVIYTRKGKGIYIKKIPSSKISRIPKLLVFIDLNSSANSDILKEYLKGLISGQEKKYFDVVYSLPDPDVDKMLDMLERSNAEGVILLEDKMFSLLEKLYLEKIPHVVIHPIHQKHDLCVDIDDNYAIRQSVIKLVQSDRNKILFIGHDLYGGHNLDKLNAYKQALEMENISFDETRVINFSMDSDFSTKLNSISEGLKLNLANFDAIVIIDLRALEVVESAITLENIDLDKTDIVIFGDYGYRNLTKLPLACIIAPRYSEAVEIGGRMLAERCVNDSLKPEVRLLKPFIHWNK